MDNRLNELKCVVEELNAKIKDHQEEVETRKIDTKFEKQRLEKFLGENLIKVLKKYNAIVAGGAITSLFTNSEINDIDVYFRNKEDVAGFISEMFGYHIMIHTSKATLFSYGEMTRPDGSPIEVQVIHYDLFDSPYNIFKSFDFTACMGAYDFKDEEFVFDKNFLKHNSQRILRYNVSPHPIVSLLRTKKYEERGYTISKPEMMRITMTCMNLNISSYSDLKEEIGGMYGINMDNIFPSDDEEEFNLIDAIDKLANLSLDDPRLKGDDGIKFSNEDDLIENALGLKPRYFVFNDEKYRVTWDSHINEDAYDMKDDAVEVNISEWLGDGIVYKYVKQDNDGKLTSFHDSSFEYKLNEEVEAKGSVGLFMGKEGEIKSFYKDHDNSILLKCKVKAEDFNGMHNGYPTFKKCIPLETVGEVYKHEDFVDLDWN